MDLLWNQAFSLPPQENQEETFPSSPEVLKNLTWALSLQFLKDYQSLHTERQLRYEGAHFGWALRSYIDQSALKKEDLSFRKSFQKVWKSHRQKTHKRYYTLVQNLQPFLRGGSLGAWTLWLLPFERFFHFPKPRYAGEIGGLDALWVKACHPTQTLYAGESVWVKNIEKFLQHLPAPTPNTFLLMSFKPGGSFGNSEEFFKLLRAKALFLSQKFPGKNLKVAQMGKVWGQSVPHEEWKARAFIRSGEGFSPSLFS